MHFPVILTSPISTPTTLAQIHRPIDAGAA
jgi:hypothetical protein